MDEKIEPENLKEKVLDKLLDEEFNQYCFDCGKLID